MEINETSIQSKYRKMLYEKTLETGRQLAVYGLPIIGVITLLEFGVFHNLTMVGTRFLAMVPLALFLSLSKYLYHRHPRRLIALHCASLMGILAMMTGIMIIHFEISTFVPTFRIGVTISGLITAAFIVYLASAGAKKYLFYLFLFPFLFLLIYFGLIKKVDWASLSLLSNPLITIIGITIFAAYDEKKAYQEFKNQKQVEHRNNQLVDEVNHSKQVAQDLQFFATRDELTGLYNRRAALAILEVHIQNAQNTQDPLTICFIDIDKLKKINDSSGHVEGDILLKKVASCLKENVRSNDFICRLGGDEFLVIFPSCNLNTAEIIIDRIRKTLNQHNIDFSYGFSEYCQGRSVTASSLIKIADANMYHQKSAKRKKKICQEESNQQPPLF
jgi:diguanylate cyclase (GGDEF)-like protein